MAEMIGRTKSWLAWLAGAVLAMVFGGAGCGRDGGQQQPVYGGPPARPAPPPAGQPDPARSGAALEDSAEWKDLAATWKDAEDVASSRRGKYPFDKAGKEKLLAGLDRAAVDLDKLAAAGLLTGPEAALLKDQKQVLAGRVAGFRTTEDQYSTCYDTVALPAAATVSSERLAGRLPLLEKLVAGGKVHQAALAKILAAADSDLAVLAEEKELARLGAGKRAEAEKTREAVKAQVEKLRALLRLGTDDPNRVRPMCYEMPAMPAPKPQSARELDERLALLERVERSGRLAAPAAEKARARILADRAEAD